MPALNFDHAVPYHHGAFPPDLDADRLLEPLSAAAAALSRYDQMLKDLHNSEILLAPLRRQEAVVSSRIEGTVSTLDEVLQYEADQGDDDGTPSTRQHRSEAVETFLYHRALRTAQNMIADGAPLSPWTLRSAHRVLLNFGRGAQAKPGDYKTEQNYLVDRTRRNVLFIPISPDRLATGMDALFAYINAETGERLLRTAVAHVEFEALHPFNDGNGRIGRMLITLMLWRYGLLSEPHFYISEFFERNKDEYIDRMRAVSSQTAWTDWCLFFLTAIEQQAFANIAKADAIRTLYDDMKHRLRDVLSSKWHTNALDFLFANPVFRNDRFTKRAGIPAPTATRFTRILTDQNLLRVIEPPAGRRAGLYAFEPLLALVRD